MVWVDFGLVWVDFGLVGSVWLGLIRVFCPPLVKNSDLILLYILGLYQFFKGYWKNTDRSRRCGKKRGLFCYWASSRIGPISLQSSTWAQIHTNPFGRWKTWRWTWKGCWLSVRFGMVVSPRPWLLVEKMGKAHRPI